MEPAKLAETLIGLVAWMDSSCFFRRFQLMFDNVPLPAIYDCLQATTDTLLDLQCLKKRSKRARRIFGVSVIRQVQLFLVTYWSHARGEVALDLVSHILLISTRRLMARLCQNTPATTATNRLPPTRFPSLRTDTFLFSTLSILLMMTFLS